MSFRFQQLLTKAFGESCYRMFGSTISNHGFHNVAQYAVDIDDVSIVNSSLPHQLYCFSSANAKTHHVNVKHGFPALKKYIYILQHVVQVRHNFL